jgi:replication factor C subunit 2/4
MKIQNLKNQLKIMEKSNQIQQINNTMNNSNNTNNNINNQTINNNIKISKIQYLNVNFPNVLDMNTFIDNYKNSFPLTHDQTKILLENFETNGINSCISDIIHYLKKSAVQQYKEIKGQDIDMNNIILPFCRKKKDKAKLVILDEADTITQKAQLLLSNILSDYIKTTRFAFICNDCSQIIETIQSKCMIIKYPKINKYDIKDKIIYICQKENIKYDENGLNALLFVSMDDIRQVINNLEYIYYTFGSLEEDNVYKLIDKPKVYYISELLKYCFNKDFKNTLNIIKELINKGYTPNDIMLSFMKYLLENETLNDEYKFKMYDIISSSYIIINETIDSVIQLCGCISNIYLYISTL